MQISTCYNLSNIFVYKFYVLISRINLSKIFHKYINILHIYFNASIIAIKEQNV